MSDPNSTTQQVNELIHRRLVDPVPFFGKELPPTVWVFILGVVLLTGFFYIGWMYFKDSRGVGIGWAILLGLLRASVYLLLAWIFLLPGRQSVESSTARSKVIVIFDTSESLVFTVDDPPKEGIAYDKMPTRQDKVLENLLLNEKVNFLGRLEEKNPVMAYRFARGLDEEFFYFDKGGAWTRTERTEFDKQVADPAHAKEPLPEPKPLPSEFWREWLKPVLPTPAPGVAPPKPVAVPEEWAEADKARFKTLQDHNQELRKKGFFRGTNVSDSVQAALTKDTSGMVQGIVVFTDGRSTEGSDLVYEDLERRAKDAKVPIFVVGLGEDRPQIKIEITDTRGPDSVQPEDRFKIVGEITGEGLADTDVEPTLEIVGAKLDKNDKVIVDKNGKEELVDVTVMEAEDKANPGKKRRELSLGREPIVLHPEKKAKFDRSSPPRVQVEYVIDAYTLAKAAKAIDLTTGEYANAKWELGETRESKLRARQHVPKDRMEVFAGKDHIGKPPLDVRVIKRPVRVLILASGPTHDFQFLNTLLIREVEKKRAEQTIYMQLPPGRSQAERRTGAVLGVPPERLLSHFPNRLDQPNEDPAEKMYDLSEYDVVVGFDPDWSQLSDEEMKVLQRWVDKGGGLIVLGGPINTVQLAKPGANKEKLKPVLELYPVILKDVRIDELDRTTDQPWPLSFESASPEMEFLKLDDNPDRRFLSDWEEFFYGEPLKKGEAVPPVQNGFFNYYPSDSVKIGSQIVARFTDPRAKMKDGTQMAYIVLSDPNSGRRVVWIASGETRRLRKHSESFFERFWTKLMRYAGAKNQGRVSKRISLNMSNEYKTNQYIEIDARIDGPGGEPLRKDKKVTVTLKLPEDADQKEIKTEIDMKPKPGNDPLDAGKFQAKFQVKSPGAYGLILRVLETGDLESREFNVVEANPELDNTRPDFDRMYKMATEADAVLARMGPSEANELKKRLQRPKLTPVTTKDGKEAKDDGKTRLYFDLKNAELIPNCMLAKTNIKTTRGQIQDIWDGPLDLSPYGLDFRIYYWWLYVAVGLFSTEWLIRKLLRLA